MSGRRSSLAIASRSSLTQKVLFSVFDLFRSAGVGGANQNKHGRMDMWCVPTSPNEVLITCNDKQA